MFAFTEPRAAARWRVAVALWGVLLLAGGCAGTAPQPGPEASGPSPALVAEYRGALARLDAGDAAGARAALETIRARHPELPGPAVNLAIIARAEGDSERAQALLEEALEAAPAFAPAHHQLGLLLRERGRFDAADAAYARALDADPAYAKAHFNRAVLNDLYLDRAEVALAHFETYSELAGEADARVAAWIVELRRRVQADAQLGESR